MTQDYTDKHGNALPPEAFENDAGPAATPFRDKYSPEYLDWLDKIGSDTESVGVAKPQSKTAAGVVYEHHNGDVLFMRRADGHGDFGGHWAFPGGVVEPGETHEDAARREGREETGHPTDGELHPLAVTHQNGVVFTTFLHPVDEQFHPGSGPDAHEHDAFVWTAPSRAPEPLHPGVRALLDALNGDERV